MGIKSAMKKDENKDFLPLTGGPAKAVPKIDEGDNQSTVLYIGRIPHGFYEDEIQAFFKQFGPVKRLRIARNRKTGKSKHFGFIEFESPEVARIVEDCMHNWLVYEHVLQVKIVPPEKVHPKLWKNANRVFKPLNWVLIERKRHDKERTADQHKKLVEKVIKRDQKRRKRIEAAGIDYECPELLGDTQSSPKKIKIDDAIPEKMKIDANPVQLDDAKPKKIKIDEAKTKKIKIDDAKPKIKIDEAKPKTIKIDDAKPKKMKIDEAKPKKIKIDDAKPKKIKIDEAKPKKIDEAKPKKMKIDDAKPKKMKIDDAKPKKVKRGAK